MTLMQKLEDAGYPEKCIYNNGSDLYIFATPLTTKVIHDWMQENGLGEKNAICSKIRDRTTKIPMYNIAFQYVPYWANANNADWKAIERRVGMLCVANVE